MNRFALRAAFASICVFAVQPTAEAQYTVTQILDGLNQPIYITQAPGDDDSLYIVERSVNGGDVGRVLRHDPTTGINTTFVDLPGDVISDGGALNLTFHPNYETNGLFYVVTNDDGTNRLDEYSENGGSPTFQKRLLEFDTLENVFHTMNWIGFRPNGDANELFVTVGDGGTQANSGQFDSELIESLDSPYGKLLRVDLTADFSTPAAGASAATHPGIDVVASGFRNPYRASFDRSTGDLYIGDIGFQAVEEVDFIPVSEFINPSTTPLNFGWTDREGTIETVGNNAGGPLEPGDIQPIFEYAHPGITLPHDSSITGRSITGGYLYRGPVEAFQGRYFFADFQFSSAAGIFSGVFDTSTPVASYDGTNLTDVQSHLSEFNSLSGETINSIVSFGEDHLGNLYIVDIGGEIYRLEPSDFVLGDLNRDGSLTGDDWSIFIANNLLDLSSFTEEEQYARGDLNADGKNNFLDFRIFQQEFDMANGAGAFARLSTQVPEPGALVSAAMLACLVCACRTSCPKAT